MDKTLKQLVEPYYKQTHNGFDEFVDYEDVLTLLNEPSKVDNTSLEYFKGCPNCKTDNYLMDL